MRSLLLRYTFPKMLFAEQSEDLDDSMIQVPCRKKRAVILSPCSQVASQDSRPRAASPEFKTPIRPAPSKSKKTKPTKVLFPHSFRVETNFYEEFNVVFSNDLIIKCHMCHTGPETVLCHASSITVLSAL